MWKKKMKQKWPKIKKKSLQNYGNSVEVKKAEYYGK